MSYSQERTDIMTYLAANWSATPIDAENSPSGEPDLPFIQPTILNAQADALTLRYQTIRYPGVISINVWAAQGTGTKTANAHADDLVDLFTDKNIGVNVETMAAYKTVIGEADGRYQINVTVPFERRE